MVPLIVQHGERRTDQPLMIQAGGRQYRLAPGAAATLQLTPGSRVVILCPPIAQAPPVNVETGEPIKTDVELRLEAQAAADAKLRQEQEAAAASAAAAAAQNPVLTPPAETVTGSADPATPSPAVAPIGGESEPAVTVEGAESVSKPA